MLACWSCGCQFAGKIVNRDGILKGRVEWDGGPYRLYRCPSCGKTSKIEQTPRGRSFASPEKEITPVEFLFSWAELLPPSDFLRIMQWHRQVGDQRRRFFEKDGDQRYSRTTMFDLLRRVFSPGDDAALAQKERASEGSRARHGSSRPKDHEPRRGTGPRGTPKAKPEPEIPHPYRILGVHPDASDAEIRSAFKRLAFKWHPDKQATEDHRVLEIASRRLAELVKAYEELRNKS